MGIEQFGESLLQRQRQRLDRRDEEFRKEQKRQRKYALIGTGVKLANNFLKERTENFLRSEEVMAQKALYKTAASNASQILAVDDAINRSGKSAADYFYETDREAFENMAREYVPLDQQTNEAGIGVYQRRISEEARKIAEERALKHAEAVSRANNLVDREDFEAMIAAAAKEARPSNVFGMLDGAARRAFSGKSREELDTEIFDDVKNSFEMENVTALNAFMSEYNKSKNLAASYDYGNFVLEQIKDVDRYETDVSSEAKVVGDSLVVVKKTTKTDRTRAGNDTSKIDEISVQFTDTDDAATLNSKVVKGLNEGFNFATDGIRFLNPEAWSRFQGEVAEKFDTTVTNIKNPTEYSQVSALFKTYSDIPENLRDEFRDKVYADTFDILASDALDLQSFIAGLEEDPDNAKALYDQLITKLLSTVQNSLDIARQTRGVNFADL